MVVGAGGAGKDRKRKRKRGDSTQKAWEPAKQGWKSRLGPELTGEKKAGARTSSKEQISGKFPGFSTAVRCFPASNTPGAPTYLSLSSALPVQPESPLSPHPRGPSPEPCPTQGLPQHKAWKVQLWVRSSAHFNEEKISSGNKYIFNEPFSGRLNYFSSHTEFINPLPSVVVPYYKFKNILRAPSPTIPEEQPSICSQKMRI